MQDPHTTFSRLYLQWRDGDAEAQDKLIRLVWRDLHRVARRLLQQERDAGTLQPTLLANETCLRLLETSEADWQNRQHFMLVAARQMRLLLIDHARHVLAQKRLRYPNLIPLDESIEIIFDANIDLLALNEALERFEELDPRASRVVELRFFFGATEKEIAEVLGVSLITVKRDWKTARLWLYEMLRSGIKANS